MIAVVMPQLSLMFVYLPALHEYQNAQIQNIVSVNDTIYYWHIQWKFKYS